MKFIISVTCTVLMFGMVVSAAAPIAQGQKRPLDPNSITLLNNVLDHLKDTKHALDEASADRDGHHKLAQRLLEEVTNEVAASRESLLRECGTKCAGVH